MGGLKELSNRYISVAAYPIPSSPIQPCKAPLSAAKFFCDSPWLNVPSHRKTCIIAESIYPRLGLLGGASSKLAALAAARRKKEQEKLVESESRLGTSAEAELEKAKKTERKSSPLSLEERLSTPVKQPQKPTGDVRGLESSSPLPGASPDSKEAQKGSNQSEHQGGVELKEYSTKANRGQKEQQTARDNIRAEPSTFAMIIVGEASRPTKTEPSRIGSQNVDLMQVYGQDLAEAFDFAGPSPDDVVLKAQSSAKGLAIRGKE